MKSTSEIDVSGLWADGGSDFKICNEVGYTDCSIIPTDGYALLVKAKRHGRWWVLKGLKAEYRGEPLYVELLKKEYSVLSQLQHPYIVNAIDMHEVEPYGMCIVMEYLEGRTLGQYLNGKPSRRSRVEIARQLLSAIGYVHSKQIVHRDLKPSNIIITHNGENLKIIDFGLADTDAHCICKQPAGTVRFMSPEQMSSSVADVRNDIYSIGVILEELRLGWCVMPVVLRCKRPIEKRYNDVANLTKDLNRWLKVPKTMIVAMVCLVVTMVLAVVWNGKSVDGRTIDEMRKSQSILEMAHQEDCLVISQLMDSVDKGYKRELQRMTREKDAKKRVVEMRHVKDKILTDGKQMVENMFVKYDRKPFVSYAAILNAIDDIEKKIDLFVKEKGSELTDQDKGELRCLLMLEFADCSNKYIPLWEKKIVR